MEIIDESKTQSKGDANLAAEIVRNYSGESIYSSEDDIEAEKEDTIDHQADDVMLNTFSPSISAAPCDVEQRYKAYGPKIKLMANSSMRDEVRYHNALDIETTNKYRRGHGRSGHDGYDSDRSEESISRISQSYGAYLYDTNYRANLHKMHSRSLRLSRFQHRDSESSLFYDDQETPRHRALVDRRSNTPNYEVTATATVAHHPSGSTTSTVIRDETPDPVPTIKKFTTTELQALRDESRARGITELVNENGAIPEIKDLTVRANAKVSFARIDAIVNDNDYVSRPDAPGITPEDAQQRSNGYSRQRLYTVDPQEVEELELLTSDEEENTVPQREVTRKAVDRFRRAEDLEERALVEQMENSKVGVPVPDYQEPSIHSIMNDDILTPSSQLRGDCERSPSVTSPEPRGGIRRRKVIRKRYAPKHFMKGSPRTPPSYHKNSGHGKRVRANRNGYQQFESMSVTMDEMDLHSDALHSRGTTVQIVPETDTIPVEHPMSDDDQFDGVYGKLNMLQSVNATLKRKVAEQSKEIHSLKTENLNLSSELQRYKLMVERNRSERRSDAVQNPLFRQMLVLKEELDKTRHRLLQYEIFDEHSEVDINGLLNTVDNAMHSADDLGDITMRQIRSESNATTTTVGTMATENESGLGFAFKPRKRFDTETMPLIAMKDEEDVDSEWLRIEKYIKLGNVQSIEQLLESGIAMDTSEAVNFHSILEAAVSYNQREIVQQILSSKKGIKMGTKLLCHRYYEGETILMIAVTNGAVEIANDLLEYYLCNTIHFGAKGEEHLLPFMNMRDDHGRTLLMKVCTMDRADLVHWVLTQYFNQKIELKTLIEARDDAGNDVFGGYVRSKAVESVIHEYAPLIDM